MFIGLKVYCDSESNKLRIYEFNESNGNIPQDGLVLTVSVAKQWDDEELHPTEPVGAQYDGVLENYSEYIFKNWTTEITFSDETQIDSSWNGDFSVKENKLTFTAKGDPATVSPGRNATFGAVMYSDTLMEMKSYRITGYRIIKMQDTVMFHFLLLFLTVWCIVLIMHIVIGVKTKRYKERQELDQKIINQSMSTFTGFIDAKDAYTRGHSARVAEYSSEIARRMKMGDEEVRKIHQIALMHDCGKIGIPDAVLKKPGPLSDEEYNIIKSHTVLGDEVLVNFTAIPEIRDGAHYHHERYDGQGYPTGKKGKEIPLCARIICVADAFDAMSSNRCYRKHLSREKIIEEFKKNTGKQFDPELVPYMIDMMEDGYVQKIHEAYPVDVLGNQD